MAEAAVLEREVQPTSRIEARFLAKVDQNGPVAKNNPELGRCWLWLAYKHPFGHGKFGVGQTVLLAHRWSYEHWVSVIPEGLQLDHFACDEPSCVNPRHVRPVTNRENVLRGNTVAAVAASRTQCPSGHPYDESNTYINPNSGFRQCRKCHANQEMKRRKRLGNIRGGTVNGL